MNKEESGTPPLAVRYRTMNNNSELATMHAFWLVQRNIAKMEEELSGTQDLCLRNFLEVSLKAEERKLAAMV